MHYYSLVRITINADHNMNHLKFREKKFTRKLKHDTFSGKLLLKCPFHPMSHYIHLSHTSNVSSPFSYWRWSMPVVVNWGCGSAACRLCRLLFLESAGNKHMALFMFWKHTWESAGLPPIPPIIFRKYGK